MSNNSTDHSQLLRSKQLANNNWSSQLKLVVSKHLALSGLKLATQLIKLNQFNASLSKRAKLKSHTNLTKPPGEGDPNAISRPNYIANIERMVINPIACSSLLPLLAFAAA